MDKDFYRFGKNVSAFFRNQIQKIHFPRIRKLPGLLSVLVGSCLTVFISMTPASLIQQVRSWCSFFTAPIYNFITIGNLHNFGIPAGLTLLGGGVIWCLLPELKKISQSKLAIFANQICMDYTEGLKSDGIIWKKGYAHTKIFIKNSTNKIYTNVTVSISPDKPIIKASAFSDFADPRIAPIQISSSPRIVSLTDKGDEEIIGEEDESQNISAISSYKLFCPGLPAKTHIEVNIATINPSDPDDWLSGADLYQKERCDLTHIYFSISYQEGEQQFDENQKIIFKINENDKAHS